MAPFCSTDCQKECWRIHKLICGAEPDVFRQAPLSSSEMTALDGLRGRRYGGPDGVQFDKYIMSVCWREPSLQTWPGIRALLVAPVTSPPVPVEEGVRETIICYSPGRDDGDWLVELFAMACRHLRGYLYETVWLSYALSLLIERKTTAPIPVRKRWFELLLVHCNRQGDFARAAPVESRIQNRLAGFADDRIREYGVMILSGKFGNLIEGQAG
ncbi:hypothetical protein B0A53_04369 [Rhodotorula sp. CCFEE 5036]|nr:hypothetical protein B0A53_04369 [Rhodotorula sp. CCFEE 5036]